MSFTWIFIFSVCVNANIQSENDSSLKHKAISLRHYVRSHKNVTKFHPRGIIICSSENQVGETIDVITQIRELWHSTIPISVAHCNEISATSKHQLDEILNVNVYNICNRLFPSFSNMKDQQQRLRGYFCKPAALIKSPYEETLMIDTDTIWLKSPELLFDSKGFLDTGALLFRDRLITNGRGNPDDFVRYIERLLKPINATQLAISNGVSLFWFYKAFPDQPGLRHVQDSSVVLLRKSQHPRMLETLQLMLSDFTLGYGDKESYWVAATISQEPFSWEPYLFATYGDCGPVLHYDPRDPNNISPEPFYINGEYLLECAVKVGQDLSSQIGKPIRVTSSTKIFNLGNRYDGYTGGLCGVCNVLGCIPASNHTNSIIRAVQSIRVRNNRSQTGSRCGNK